MTDIVRIGFDIATKSIGDAYNALGGVLDRATELDGKLKGLSKGSAAGLSSVSDGAKKASAEVSNTGKQVTSLATGMSSLGRVGVATFREYEQYAKKLTREWEQVDKATKKAQQTFENYSNKSSFKSNLGAGNRAEAQYQKDLGALRAYYKSVESADKQAEQARKNSFSREIKLIEDAKSREQQAYQKDLAAMRKYYEQQEKMAAKAASSSGNTVVVGFGGKTPKPFDDGYATRAKSVQDSNILMARSFNVLGLSLGQIGFGFVLQRMLEMADGYALLQSRIKLFSDSSDDLGAVNKRLLAISNANRASLEDTGRLYVKLLQPLRELGSTSEEVLTVTDAFSKALFVGGANAREASAAIIQFSQAMASGKLSGDRKICHPTK